MLAVAALVGCAKEETLTFDKGEEIGFSSFVDNATRVVDDANNITDPSYKPTTLDHFNVYGTVNNVNIFNGNSVNKSGTAWDLTGTKQYWIAGAAYKFVAIVDGNKTVDSNVITSTTIDNTTGMPTSVTYKSDGATDLLCDVYECTAKTDGTANPTVSFAFTHLLSKVKFSVKNTSDAPNYRIQVNEVKLTNVYSEGVYNIPATSTASDTWTLDTDNLGDRNLDNNYSVEANSVKFNSNEVLLIPGSAVGVHVNAEIQVKHAVTNEWTEVTAVNKTFTNVLGSGNTLEANKAYHFAVSYGIGSEIQFSATLTDWTDGDGDGDTQLN